MKQSTHPENNGMPPVIPLDPLDGLLARQADLLLDPDVLEKIYLGQWPHVDRQVLGHTDQILARLRDRPRSMTTRLLDLLPGYRTIRSGSSHPVPARLAGGRLAACRLGMPRRIKGLVRSRRIERWEGAAFLRDLEGESHQRIARRARCSRWQLECSLLRTRRRLLQTGAIDALATATRGGE